jgi:RNA polymerase sigma-70 factor (ECF subfamily)
MTDQLELSRLIQDTAAGNHAAFERLYQLTAPKLLGYCQRMFKNIDSAEDLLQDIYVKIWHHASEYQTERGNVLTWMFTILRYTAIDRLRARRVTVSLDGDLIDSLKSTQAEPPSATMHAQTMDNLQRCLNQLSETQRSCISLAFFEGLTHQELTERLQHPLGTVKSWVRRGLISLRRCLLQ